MELAREFLPDDGFEIIPYNDVSVKDFLGKESFFVNETGSSDRDTIKRELYDLLSRLTGLKPPWGTLTGVRPLKPAIAIAKNQGIGPMESTLKERYLLSEDKTSLLKEIAEYQISLNLPEPHTMVSLYAGIPFCPSRCEYCSFASAVASQGEMDAYFEKLIKETGYAGRLARDNKARIESAYIGGGTPTTLSASKLKTLVSTLAEAFDFVPGSIELSVEAGRPDTIDEEKLHALKESGVNRISINPQSMKDETLKTIGRNHSAGDIRHAYELAGKVGFDVINADLIAGLAGEDERDFEASLKEIIELNANNITIHTLSVKSGSRLKENDPSYYRKGSETVVNMLGIARKMLTGSGFKPYYIYRQKHQIASLENIGWCRPGKHSLYNIRIMEDRQSIIGLGAGAVGKVYYPSEDRIERIANVSNYKIYEERFDDILKRKNGYFS